jgi:regulator of protease activity HflC (stomatin/prohibitin superfamily)
MIRALSSRRLLSSSSHLYRYGGGPKAYDQRPLPVNTIVKFVPQQQAWVVERFGKFHRILEPGLAVLFPVFDQIRYVKTLKEVAVEIPSQAAITHDNVTINMDGVLYYRVIDPFKVTFLSTNPFKGVLWSRGR